MDGMLSQDEINALLNGMDLDGGGDAAGPATPDSDSDVSAPAAEPAASSNSGIDESLLSDIEKDAIGEVANISMGTSATTLYSLVNRKVNITTPQVSLANWETVTEEYDMDNNMVISNNLVTEYVKDDSLKDKVKIEYTYYYDYFEFEPNTYVNEIDGYKVYHMNYNVNWGTNSFKNLIRDLKKKKFNNVMDVVTVKVITSNSNIKTIKRNNENYVSRNDIEFDGVDLDELDEDDIGSIGMR